jgi:hypothetical protein
MIDPSLTISTRFAQVGDGRLVQIQPQHLDDLLILRPGNDHFQRASSLIDNQFFLDG